MSILTMGPDRLAEVLARVDALAGKELLIGIPEAEGPRDDGSPVSNAAIGYINEYGSPQLNIPARPHLVPGVREALPVCISHMERAARAALQSGNGADAEAGLHAAGLAAVASVQRYLTKGTNFAALSAATLARRRAKGHAGDKPLIETGSYRRALSHALRPRKP